MIRLVPGPVISEGSKGMGFGLLVVEHWDGDIADIIREGTALRFQKGIHGNVPKFCFR